MCKMVGCFLSHERHVRRFLHVLLRCPLIKRANQKPFFLSHSISFAFSLVLELSTALTGETAVTKLLFLLPDFPEGVSICTLTFGSSFLASWLLPKTGSCIICTCLSTYLTRSLNVGLCCVCSVMLDTTALHFSRSLYGSFETICFIFVVAVLHIFVQI